jgi:hypothetical protein
MTIHGERELELGPDAVDGGHEDGLAVLPGVEGEQAAEAADLAENLATVCGGEELGEGALDLVAEIDVDPGGGVGFLLHLWAVRLAGAGAEGIRKLSWGGRRKLRVES